MNKRLVVATILSVAMMQPALAGKVDTGAVVGGAVGGGTGAAVGSAVGGRDGAIIGGAIGGAAGAAIGSSPRKEPKKVVVKERVVVKEVVYVEGPPGHRHGKKKGWKKHHKDKYHD